MSLHAWNEQLDLGNEEIDREHHLQIEMASALLDAIEQRRHGAARGLFEQLYDYTNAHFGAEELLMRYRSYPGYSQHREEHHDFLAQLDEMRSAFEDGDDALALGMTIDLRAWLARHMAASDRPLAEFVARR